MGTIGPPGIRRSDLDLGRYCIRCGEATHGDHLCADIRKRRKRREKQVVAVMDIMAVNNGPQSNDRFVAEHIVSRLSDMDVSHD